MGSQLRADFDDELDSELVGSAWEEPRRPPISPGKRTLTAQLAGAAGGRAGTLAPGKVSRAPARAGAGGATATEPKSLPERRMQEQAGVLLLAAVNLRRAIVPGWQAALDSLDAARVQARATEIVTQWRLGDRARRAIEREEAIAEEPDPIIERHGGMELMLMPPDFERRKPAPHLPDVERARQAWRLAEKHVGAIVNLQELAGTPVLGARRFFEIRGSVPVYVQLRAAQATRTIGSIHRLAAIAAVPAGKTQVGQILASLPPEARWRPMNGDDYYLDDEQIKVALGILSEHTDSIEFKFIGAAMNKLGHWAGLDEVLRSKEGKRLEALVRDLGAVTRHGRDARGIDQARLEEMRADAKRIADEVDDFWYASDSLINAKLAKYPDPREREIFFRLLERENAIDPMLKRGDTANVEHAMRGTPGFHDRRYNASFDTSMTVWESAGYMGAEAARQTPGGVCQFAAGVFDGLSHVPVVGRVFAKSAAGFRDLSRAADQWTGAHDDELARKWRNGIASTAGAVDALLLSWGVAAEAHAVKGAGAVVTAATVGAKANEIREIVEFIVDLKSMYDEGKVMWDTAATALKESGELLSDIRRGDWAAPWTRWTGCSTGSSTPRPRWSRAIGRARPRRRRRSGSISASRATSIATQPSTSSRRCRRCPRTRAR